MPVQNAINGAFVLGTTKIKTNFVVNPLRVTKAGQPKKINSSQTQEESVLQCQLVPCTLAGQV